MVSFHDISINIVGATTAEKPSVTVYQGGKATLCNDGKTLTITPDEGDQIKSVTLNKEEKGAVTKLTELKATDKIIVTFVEKPQTSVFADITNHWGKQAILYAVEKGLFNGTSETEFSPDSSMTRGMLVTVLYRMEGQPEGKVTPFRDVASGKWYTKAITWANEKEIVEGVSQTLFAPEDAITREQLATILYRYLGAPIIWDDTRLAWFADAKDISFWAKNAMIWAVNEGVFTGKSDTKLDPASMATRAEVAEIFMRLNVISK